jgi:glutamyl-Q tRNA(Asp) synthetase
VRIEDVDLPRCIPGADQRILQQLADCGLMPDEPATWQSQRSGVYQQALDQLIAQAHAYPCACSRKDIEQTLHALGRDKPRHGELVYPGTCRHGLQGKHGRAWRFRAEAVGAPHITCDAVTHWTDRRTGPQAQDVATEVGDFVLQRADGHFAYQLAVVVDDAAQGITHIVRGEDLADNTARQILLQQALGYPRPQYLHTPLVLAADGQKLSKQNGAQGLDTGTPEAALTALNQAARVLGLQSFGTRDNRGIALAAWIEQWRATLQSANT